MWWCCDEDWWFWWSPTNSFDAGNLETKTLALDHQLTFQCCCPLPFLFCFVLLWGPHKPRSCSCFLSLFLEVSCILRYHTTPIILFLALPSSLLQQLQSFSGIINLLLLSLHQCLSPEPYYYGYAVQAPVLRVTQAERKKNTGKGRRKGRAIYR